MKILKYRTFQQWAKLEAMSDSLLKDAIDEVERGLVEANLGSGLYKKRMAKEGRGKSGGYRTLLAFKQGNRAIFIYGFAKNERDNITNKELLIYRRLAISQVLPRGNGC
jgi:hypothetical protein